MTIRRATIKDLATIQTMGLRFIAETPYVAFGSSPEALERILRIVLEHGVGFLAIVDGAAIGMIGVIAAPHPLTGMPYADEIVWWVEPEYRRGTIGPRLLVAAETWATTNGMTWITMIAPFGTDVGRFYERQGYEAIETSYLKRL